MIQSILVSRFGLMKGSEVTRSENEHNTMKTTLKIVTGLALLSLLAGCVVTSVYPFYQAKDVVFDPSLVGVWADAGSTNAVNEHWQFEKAEGQAYRLTVQDKEKPTEFDAHLFKLKGRLYLDMYPRERAENSLPVHYLLKVTRCDAVLEYSLFDYDWLTKLVQKHPKAIRHLVVPNKLGESGDGLVVLTAETAELQKFILKHEKTEGAFGKASELKRWKN